ncbi:MAG: VCBS repeat-containing protein, partial [Bacteroidota bacterium]
QEHLIEYVPGAIRTEIRDVDKDGWPDIIALMAQGNEGVFLFRNKSNGQFEQSTLLRFQPLRGSSYFELVDFDGDGDEDILLANGDNADYSYTLKDYHGIRLYTNDGNFQFSETFFYPLYGATKALARDFDGDGDLDIAAIAFFADFEQHPEQAFVYLDNQSTDSIRFQTNIIEDTPSGHWIVMDTGDIDGDGDEDIALGSFTFAPTPIPDSLQKQWRQTSPQILFLENKLR